MISIRVLATINIVGHEEVLDLHVSRPSPDHPIHSVEIVWYEVPEDPAGTYERRINILPALSPDVIDRLHSEWSHHRVEGSHVN